MKKKIDVKKPKAELRVGFECMENYLSPHEKDAGKEILRFYFKGRVVKFIVAKRHPFEEIDGVRGNRLDLITDSPNANIWYEAFERADGVVFFLGESETQSVAKSTRNLAYRHLDRFN